MSATLEIKMTLVPIATEDKKSIYPKCIFSVSGASSALFVTATLFIYITKWLRNIVIRKSRWVVTRFLQLTVVHTRTRQRTNGMKELTINHCE